MEIKSPYQEHPTTPEQIRAAEKVIGVRLPEEYRRYLLSHLGGHPDPDAFRVQWSGQEWAEGNEINCVAWMLSPYDGEHENLVDYFKTHVGRVPADTIPIARDPGSNLILLGVSEHNKGRVYFWQRDYEVDPGSGDVADYSNVGFVADSFDEFINSLFKP